MHIDDTVLQQVMERLAAEELEARDVQSAFSEIVAALPPLFGAAGAGILLVDESQVLRHAGSTDAGAQLLEAVQESTGRGPCVQALVDDVTVTVPDVVSDERWPELGPLLEPNGVRAVIGVPVRVGGVPVGSVNVYSREPHAWDDSDRAALAAIEAVIERLLTAAVLAGRQEELIGQLQRALEARVLVERAVGVVMAVGDLDAAEAFERLRRSARSTRRPVRDVAGDVLASRKLP